MAILGIDYGAKKIGVAKSDDSETMALPLEIIANISQSAVLERLKKICHDNDILKIVVGVPISLAAGDSQHLIRQVDLQNQQMKEVLEFVSWLAANIGLPVLVEDERLSTKQAAVMNKDLAKRGADDDVAAMLILQSYLDRAKFLPNHS